MWKSSSVGRTMIGWKQLEIQSSKLRNHRTHVPRGLSSVKRSITMSPSVVSRMTDIVLCCFWLKQCTIKSNSTLCRHLGLWKTIVTGHECDVRPAPRLGVYFFSGGGTEGFFRLWISPGQRVPFFERIPWAASKVRIQWSGRVVYSSQTNNSKGLSENCRLYVNLHVQ